MCVCCKISPINWKLNTNVIIHQIPCEWKKEKRRREKQTASTTRENDKRTTQKSYKYNERVILDWCGHFMYMDVVLCNVHCALMNCALQTKRSYLHLIFLFEIETKKQRYLRISSIHARFNSNAVNGEYIWIAWGWLAFFVYYTILISHFITKMSAFR